MKIMELMNHDLIFHQPDLVPPSDDDVAEAVTYFATATRTGKQWAATAELPGGRIVQSQGTSWADVKRNVCQLIFDALRDEPEVIGVHVAPADSEAKAALAAVVEARQARVLAEQAERDAVRHAARLLTAQGWTTRDVGSAMRLSHQRISQILKESSV
ncbi:hypothetical protein [Nonomuraea aridisoli]|uniref:hypothetical protein n=1 Tax=Nonomuraea aridisoli TaxID=2070368 RepID=UPI0015E8A6AE|nr:hypothetical protein [Nonomuraea aridisoli]